MEDHSFIFLNNTHNSNIKNVYCDPLPLNSYIDEEYPIFGEINYNIFDFNKDKSKLENSSQILNKINKFEDTYYNNLKSFPNTEAKLHDKQILEKNLNLIENTLPGFIICLMYRNNNIALDEEKIFEIVLKKYNDLRKPNGCKYKVSIPLIKGKH
jgi:hypothetical protein